MIFLDNYSLIYEKKKNRIIINLPQTIITAVDSAGPVVNRKVDVKNEELTSILFMAKLIFESNKKEENAEND